MLVEEDGYKVMNIRLLVIGGRRKLHCTDVFQLSNLTSTTALSRFCLIETGKSEVISTFTGVLNPAFVQPLPSSNAREVDQPEKTPAVTAVRLEGFLSANIKLRVGYWDTTPEDRYRSIYCMYSDGFMLLYNVCDRESFRSIRAAVQVVQDHILERHTIPPYVLVGTHADEPRMRVRVDSLCYMKGPFLH